jgi:TonB family protein
MLYNFAWLILLLLTAIPDATQPSLVHLETVEYPRLAWQARIVGEVNVEVHIAADGSVSSASASSGHELLQRAACENVKKWIFLPGREFNLEIIYDFRLEKPESTSQRATKMVLDLRARRVIVICNLPALNT